MILCENCGCGFHHDGLQTKNTCNDCLEIDEENKRITSICQNCNQSFYREIGMGDICDDCLKHEEKIEEYLIDFTNFIPEERDETLHFLVYNNGSSGSPCDYLLRFKDKEFFLNEWEFEAMCKLIKRKNDVGNLGEDEIFQ